MAGQVTTAGSVVLDGAAPAKAHAPVVARMLAAGFVPHGKLGGEASFRGQANGLWLWQNDVGQMIVEQLLADQDAARGARRAIA